MVANHGENSTPVHSIDFPGCDNSRPVKNGELFKVDMIMVYEGCICDFGRSTAVGGKADPIKKMLETVTNASERLCDPWRLPVPADWKKSCLPFASSRK